MIWRDDDVGAYTDQFIAVDKILHEHGRIHTSAVIGSTLASNIALRNYITENLDHIDLQVHCWRHTEVIPQIDAHKDILMCAELIMELGGKPTTIYPPYNKTNPTLNAVAEYLGLTISIDNYSLAQFVARQGRVPRDSVINFHHWNPQDHERLQKAMIC